MPKSAPDELSNADIDALETLLRALREELTESLRLGADGAKTVDLDNPIGRLSRIDAIQQQRMAQANQARAKMRLEQVAGAISKIERDDDTYGYCVECGELIALKRLRARPESPFCIECQESSEGRSGRRRRPKSGRRR